MKCSDNFGIKFFYFLVLIFVSHVSGQNDSSANIKRTKLSVYYETLCGDSKAFFKRQLMPFLNSSIAKYVDLELVSYGKATTKMERVEIYTFECQHKQEECEGNKLHSCVLKYLPKKIAEKVIGCSMSNVYPPAVVKKCVANFKSKYNAIINCMQTLKGSELLSINGVKTKQLRPSLYYVPWIVFDGVWIQQTHESALYNLKSEVCKKIGQDICYPLLANTTNVQVTPTG